MPVSDVVVALDRRVTPTVFAFFTDIERWTAWQGVGGKSTPALGAHCA